MRVMQLSNTGPSLDGFTMEYNMICCRMNDVSEPGCLVVGTLAASCVWGQEDRRPVRSEGKREQQDGLGGQRTAHCRWDGAGNKE